MIRYFDHLVNGGIYGMDDWTVVFGHYGDFFCLFSGSEVLSTPVPSSTVVTKLRIFQVVYYEYISGLYMWNTVNQKALIEIKKK